MSIQVRCSRCSGDSEIIGDYRRFWVLARGPRGPRLAARPCDVERGTVDSRSKPIPWRLLSDLGAESGAKILVHRAMAAKAASRGAAAAAQIDFFYDVARSAR